MENEQKERTGGPLAEELLEKDPEPPTKTILIIVVALCLLLVAGFIWYALRLNANPERECAFRGGVWKRAGSECIFENSAQGNGEQTGMKAGTITLSIPDQKPEVTVTFQNIEVGVAHTGSESFVATGTPVHGAVSLVSELGRVQSVTGDLVMPFAVNFGGSGTLLYLGVFNKGVNGGYTLRGATFAGDRISPQTMSLNALDERSVYIAKFTYRDRRDGEPLSAVPTEPRTLELTILNSSIQNTFVTGRDGLMYKDFLRVSQPSLGAGVSSPLVVSGTARGSWYFEASFPVMLVDWDGKILAEGHAQAKGDWMTKDFVPFEATLTYTVPTDIPYKRATLILKKDNPSGLPEHDDAFEFPVVLK